MDLTLKEIVEDNKAILSYICSGIAFYTIDVGDNTYQFEIDSTEDEWKTTYLYPEYKAITLMRWIRKCIKEDKFIKIK